MVLTLSDMGEALIFYIRHRERWSGCQVLAGRLGTHNGQLDPTLPLEAPNSRPKLAAGPKPRATRDKMSHNKADAGKDMEWDRSEKRALLARRRHRSAY